MRVVLDIESNSLLNDSSIDYTASPYKLKDSFVIHCVDCKDVDTGVHYSFVQDEVFTKYRDFMQNVTTLIQHNGINFDLLALKMYLGIPYTVEPDTYDNRDCEIVDTLVLSRTLNPERRGHSVEYYGQLFGLPKIDWRTKAIELGLCEHDSPKGAEFQKYHPEMLVYCQRDVDVQEKIWRYLEKEKQGWNWESAISLEKSVAELITRQEHRGFAFNSKLAYECITDLDQKMQELKAVVEPVLPPKPLAKTTLKDFTPASKQFKKDGTLSTHMLNFIEKHNGEMLGDKLVRILGKEYTLPMPIEPIVTSQPATLKDSTHIKEWLVGTHKWEPSQFKERDLTVDSKKRKLTKEKYIDAVQRYVDQTLNCAFKEQRLEHIGCTGPALFSTLIKKDIAKPVKVLTNPTFTIGQEKEIDPKLLELKEQFPHAEKIVYFLTYQHRRNSILGGGFDPDLDDEEDMEKGFLANVRADGRIPTPANTCGAATSRFTHKLCANIARVTSIYGEQMRSLFGVSDGFYQIGYDFNSLEAIVESGYCYKYPGGPEYGVSLTAEKPNDCHSVLARKITDLIGKPFPRVTAKSVKYGCSYNAQVKRVAKIVGCDLKTAEIIFDAFWEAAKPLAFLKEAMQKYWETTGQKKFLLGLDGRKIPIRSKGNVINSAFQSAGVIYAKRAMVIHDRKMRDEGLTVDFFMDDWQNLSFGQQMIAYHDESQLEVSKDLVQFKMFDTEEEAKAFQDDSKVWSEVGHGKKYYRAYSRVGELAIESVREAGAFYKLPVNLTAGYMVHKHWAGCH